MRRPKKGEARIERAKARLTLLTAELEKAEVVARKLAIALEAADERRRRAEQKAEDAMHALDEAVLAAAVGPEALNHRGRPFRVVGRCALKCRGARRSTEMAAIIWLDTGECSGLEDKYVNAAKRRRKKV